MLILLIYNFLLELESYPFIYYIVHLLYYASTKARFARGVRCSKHFITIYFNATRLTKLRVNLGVT